MCNMPQETAVPGQAQNIRIGRVESRGRVFLAPMSGVTDAPFRRAAWELGAGLVISEMIASSMLAAGDTRARLQAEGARTGIHVVQLAGCEARWLAEGARIAEASGAQIIDINMGCPAKRVTNGYAGSALMREPDQALKLIEATVSAVSVPVTVKMRLGWDFNSINAPALAARAERAGAQMITVHGRTRCQFYEGRADWTAIRSVKEAVKIPVVANGDIADFSDVDEALAESGADALMVGRATTGAPWLAGQFARYVATRERKPPLKLPMQKAIMLRLYEEMLVFHGSGVGLRHARKHLRAAIDTALADLGIAIDGPVAQKRSEALTSQEPTTVVRCIEQIYDLASEKAAA